MYNRSYRQRRPPTIPINYSGNAFSRTPPEKGNFDVMPIPSPPMIEVTPTECEEKHADKCEKECDDHNEKPSECGNREDSAKHNFLSGLFGGKLFPRGIGSEELLLLALIILVSQSGEADDLLIYLAILLFS